jgi:putative ABC transport system permease protein
LNIWGFDTDEEADKLVTSSGFLDVEEGRQIKTGDKYKAIVGYAYAYDTFDKDIVIGSKITIEDKEFEVIGIQKNSGTGMHDAIIRIPLDVARELYNEPESISTIFALTKADSKPSTVAEDIKRALRRHRNVKEGEEDFSVQTAEQMISSLNQILDVVTLVVVGIAAISLIVGGIGIMNTMYTTVLERTREIGIMKSIGARNSHILLLFLIESGLLGLLGGVIGVLIGLGISYVGTLIAVQMGATFFKASISVWLICGALAFSFVVGSLSGALPARQASKLQPVEALRE